MGRREFPKEILATIASFALMDSLFAYNAIGKGVKPLTDHWTLQLNECCADLKTNSITAIQWQKKIDELDTKIELAGIFKFMDFDNLIRYP